MKDYLTHLENLRRQAPLCRTKNDAVRDNALPHEPPSATGLIVGLRCVGRPRGEQRADS